MGIGIHRRGGPRGAAWLPITGLVLALVTACQPSAPPGFTGTQPPAPGSSVAVPDGSGLEAGKPVVTTDGPKVSIAGLGSGKSADFELPAGSAEMVVTPCASNQVIPFVTLYDTKDNKLSIVVEPSATLANLAGGAYYLDVATNPACVWQIVISPG